MALTDENGGMGTTMLVQPSGYAGNNGMFGDGNGWWILILFFLLCGGGMWGGMGGMGGMGMLYPWLNNSQNINDGFRDQMLNDNVTSILDGVYGISNQLCSGFAGTTAAINGAQNALAQQLYTNQISDLERSFAAQTANTQGLNAVQAQLAQCCCDNRAATADVKYTIATEACASRATSTQNTQAILDKLCQLELDGYKRENDQLRSQLQFANMQASQVAQTAELKTAGAVTANNLVSELRSCPIPSQPVYGNTPIFSCGNNVAGCGCGA